MEARVHEEVVSDADRRAWSEAYQAFRDALLEKGRSEGRTEGWTEGRTEGISAGRTEEGYRMCLKIWRHRFGEPGVWVTSRLRQCDSAELLEELADVFLSADLAEAEASVAARLGNGH